MTRAGAPLFLALLLAGGCAPESADEPAPRPEPIVVYAASGDDDGWSARFAGFTRETGIPVTVRNADDVVDAVIANRGAPPADVLLAPDVAGIVRAADEGGLRLLATGSLEEPLETRLPAALRDPDGFWFAVSVRVIAIAYRRDRPAASEIPDFAGLADPGFRGRLCLSTSSASPNRMLIAALIAELGERPAELAVRGWIANLAQPVFDSNASLMRALDDGSCSVGIVSLPAASLAENPDADAVIVTAVPTPIIADVEGIGIARHARSPDAARTLLGWLLESPPTHPDAGQIAGGNVAAAAWRVADADRLAARAGYR